MRTVRLVATLVVVTGGSLLAGAAVSRATTIAVGPTAERSGSGDAVGPVLLRGPDGGPLPARRAPAEAAGLASSSSGPAGRGDRPPAPVETLPAPEPTSGLVLGLGLAALAAHRRTARRRSAPAGKARRSEATAWQTRSIPASRTWDAVLGVGDRAEAEPSERKVRTPSARLRAATRTSS